MKKFLPCSLLLIFFLVCFDSNAKELIGKPDAENNSQVSAVLEQHNQSTVTSSAASSEISAVEGSDNSNVDKNVKHAIQQVGSVIDDTLSQQHESEHNVNAGILIPLFAIAFGLGGPIVLIIILMAFHYRSKVRKQHAINANIDKLIAAGRDIPMALLLGDEYYGAHDINLSRGIKNIGLGIGWLIFLTVLCGFEIGAFAFIFIGLGISQLIIWKLLQPAPAVQKIQD